MTEAPASLTYSTVVSRDSVRIILMIAALNGLEISSCDIQNAYLTAPCREKIYFISGPENQPAEDSFTSFNPKYAGSLNTSTQSMFNSELKFLPKKKIITISHTFCSNFFFRYVSELQA